MNSETHTLIEYMPAHLRGSHRAHGNWGVYPRNGAERVWVLGDWSDEEWDDEYTRVLQVGQPPADAETYQSLPQNL